jgi:hypothetical protein
VLVPCALPGVHIDCDGDFITLDANISGEVIIAQNTRHGILIDGHVHANVGPGVRLNHNGHGGVTQCGGGLHAHFLYGSPAVKLQGVSLVNNTAQYGAGACIGEACATAAVHPAALWQALWQLQKTACDPVGMRVLLH